MTNGTIRKVAGPLVVAEGMHDARMYDVVYVSDMRLIGEIIEIKGDRASIQVYEETGGLGPGDPVYSTGEPLSVELGPGLLGSIYDGIQRPLDKVRESSGDWISRGVNIPGLDHGKAWEFTPVARSGAQVGTGDILGTVPETEIVIHKVMVPPGVRGRLAWIAPAGAFTIDDVIARIDTGEGETEVRMHHRWPVRQGRPFREKMAPDEPLITGQRVVDAFFPVGKGGTACVPGPFGSGKTVIQHQLAKWADAEIVVYVGCGERGNEMTDVLQEFPELLDPRSGKPLILRTVLVANTSNMPVAAREASVYTGVTIAEYFRDMGYSVALMADSTSRWAEAMREMSGRLEEMPGEEGYPAYLGTRIAEFYERAGKVSCMCSEGRTGALTVVGAVSPAGGDLSDPVVQATLRVVKVFWSLQAKLAYMRHFPAIGWLESYSLYTENLREWYSANLEGDWAAVRNRAMAMLQDEANLSEIARLVGAESLSAQDQLTLYTARSIREDFLHQNAFHDIDTFCSMGKQVRLLNLILAVHDRLSTALDRGAETRDLFSLPFRERVARARYLPEDRQDEIDSILDAVSGQVAGVLGEAAGAEVSR
jgi:V/A-type H+-transporting ATPase subunit A